MASRICVLMGLLCVAACAKVAVSLDDLPCDAGECLPGYRCDPTTNMCEPEGQGCATLGELTTCGTCEPPDDCTVEVANAAPICSPVTAGFACDYDGDCDEGFGDADTDRTNGCECELVSGADVPCNGVDEDCAGGDAVETGTDANCAGCANDCGTAVLNAIGVTCTGTACNYGSCLSGFGDANNDRTDGCECAEGGSEVCDNVDNDCDSVVDDGVANCACNHGVASAEVCDGIDNDCNQAIDDTFVCTGGDLRDCDSGGGAGSGSDPCDPSTCTWRGVCTAKDTDPPAEATGFVATPGDNQVALTWTYPADTDLALCQVRRTTGGTPPDRGEGDPLTDLLDPSPGGAGSYTDTGANNQTEYSYAVFCRDSSGNWQDGVSAGNSGTATPVGDVPAEVTDLNATDGDDGQSTITFTMPAGPLDQCVVRRSTGGAPANHLDGDPVGAFTGTGVKTTDDTGLSNGTTYYYAAFCENGGAWNDSTAAAGNQDTGVPIDLAAAVSATDGVAGQSNITFTMPAGATTCKIVRKPGAYPTGDTDGTQVGGELTGGGAESVQDTGLDDDTIYFYAVFCAAGDGYRNTTVVEGENGDTRTPPVPCTPTSLAATNGGSENACGTPIDVNIELDGCSGRSAEISCSAQSLYLEWEGFGGDYGPWSDTNGTTRRSWIDNMPAGCPTSGTFVRLDKNQDNVYIQLGSAVNMTGYQNIEVEFNVAYRTGETPGVGENITLWAECCVSCTPSAFSVVYPNAASGGSDGCRQETALLDSSLDDCPNLMLRFSYPNQSNARAAVDDIGVIGELIVPQPSDDGGGSYSTSVESCYVLTRDVTCTWDDSVSSPISDTTTVSFD